MAPGVSTQLSDFAYSYEKRQKNPKFGSFRAFTSVPGPKSIGGNSMRFRTTLFLATMFLACFTIAAWSTPLPAQPGAGHLQPTPDNQSVSGTIASVGDAEFSVQVAKNKDASTVQFMVDDKTKVEGKLTVGAQATVEFRTDSGKNIAVRVVVTPASGMSLY
jgi:hypothetical protein